MDECTTLYAIDYIVYLLPVHIRGHAELTVSFTRASQLPDLIMIDGGERQCDLR